MWSCEPCQQKVVVRKCPTLNFNTVEPVIDLITRLLTVKQSYDWGQEKIDLTSRLYCISNSSISISSSRGLNKYRLSHRLRPMNGSLTKRSLDRPHVMRPTPLSLWENLEIISSFCMNHHHSFSICLGFRWSNNIWMKIWHFADSSPPQWSATGGAAAAAASSSAAAAAAAAARAAASAAFAVGQQRCSSQALDECFY